MSHVTEKGLDKESREQATPPTLSKSDNHPELQTKMNSPKRGSKKGTITIMPSAIPIKELPVFLTSRFGEGGFSRYGIGNNFVPVLELNPKDVEDKELQSKWSKMYEKVRNVTF